MQPVKSSNIKAVGYDEATKKLTVQFHSGSTHCYEDVEPHDHKKFMAAESIGSHFHQHIRSGFKSSKVEAK